MGNKPFSLGKQTDSLLKPYKGNNYRLRKYRRKYSDIVRYLFSAKRVNVFGRILQQHGMR